MAWSTTLMCPGNDVDDVCPAADVESPVTDVESPAATILAELLDEKDCDKIAQRSRGEGVLWGCSESRSSSAPCVGTVDLLSTPAGGEASLGGIGGVMGSREDVAGGW